ncbi:MAG: hypothetical protein LBU34_02120 [Planctomycetaceae bacterium]|nr:hypothetical protein [Planctomycetaceae bacterium]
MNLCCVGCFGCLSASDLSAKGFHPTVAYFVINNSRGRQSLGERLRWH